MVHKSLFSSATDEWETPQDYFDRLDSIYEFDFDLACSKENCKTADGFTLEENSLDQNWAQITYDMLPLNDKGWLWLNPPYSKITEFVDKAWSEFAHGARIVMLVPARTDTKWFHTFIYNPNNYKIKP